MLFYFGKGQTEVGFKYKDLLEKVSCMLIAIPGHLDLALGYLFIYGLRIVSVLKR